uniref:MIP09442p n=1 Tax=Drosophila melanogaster TaxID=7227 RepID=C1C3I5_DROME|nr:MIP09442p [Drosophila melanogaster]
MACISGYTSRSKLLLLPIVRNAFHNQADRGAHASGPWKILRHQANRRDIRPLSALQANLLVGSNNVNCVG